MNSVDSLATILERTRQNLLDLSLRNRLINTPRGMARSKRLDIVDELSDEVFRLLATEGASLGFLPGREAPPSEDDSSNNTNESIVRLSQPGDDLSNGPAARHRDRQLQTNLSSANLQERLLGLYYDARTFEEEQGVSILYLALGFLEWFEADASDKPRFAPLILVPVDLTRTSASARFKLKFREDDLETNLSLQAKLRAEFGLELPEVGDLEALVPSTYFAQVESAISAQSGWKVHQNEIALWFFSFTKYLMYRDLDPATWPSHSPLSDNASLRQLLVDGFEVLPSICDDNDPIDPLIPPQHLIHVTDADSSQALVIEEVRRGRNLVVQGPPGTGKSQTITNLIASAVHAGKKVLFVAEKMAALDVVKSRLDRLGLGAVCLELHSHKSNKKSTLEELNRTLALRRPRVSARVENLQQLTQVRDLLNRHAQVMNTPVEPGEITPFQIIGQLVGDHAEGAVAIPFQLTDPTRWTRAEFEERCRRLADLQNYVGELGNLTTHSWRGVQRTTPILPADLQQLIRRVHDQAEKLSRLTDTTAELCRTLQFPLPSDLSLESIQRLADLGRHGISRPALDRAAIADPIWEIHPAKIQQLVEQGQRLTAARTKLADVVVTAAWTTDLTEARQSLVTHGRCWCWFLYPDYWRAVTTLRNLVRGELPPHLNGKLELIETLQTGQTALRQIRELGATVGQRAFGALWREDASDFAGLRAIVDWEQQGREARFEQPFRAVAANLAETSALQQLVDDLHQAMQSIETDLRTVFQLLQLDTKSAFNVMDYSSIDLSDLMTRYQHWEANAESLSKWVGYQARRTAIERDGLNDVGPSKTTFSTASARLERPSACIQASGNGRGSFGSLITEFERGSFESKQIVSLFRQAYYESLFKELLERNPDLAAFHGSSHEQQIRHFQELDIERMNVARSEVAFAHFSGIPRESSLGEMAVVRGEIAKKRMHRPIRQLLRDAGRAVQAIKPVFMMSPISVAQFLEPGVLEFDLLVMDEASQVTPEDALGAMARAKQIVVVGDSRQLPPSRFFSKLLDDVESDENEDLVNTSHLDSILGLCVARGLPQRMLRWHYRSRHHSLIAVSNQEFYDNQLCVIPSPTAVSDGSGLQFRAVPYGCFDRGGTATNRREAAAIADAVIEHARNRPTKSLGVAAFSVAQRDAIRQEVELRLRNNADLDEFFSTGHHESFFVKNLENVQGDERDFIFISVGYAPDATGNLTMNFGPLGADGGERRLNVLISRAKECCVVFSSISADQIDLSRARSRGAAALKTFLKFAETGCLESDHAVSDTSDSEFERQVALALEQAGLTVHSQVGTNGLAIDLAIVDPEHDNRYLLGIECDGASYHASRWARDRDRLREAVLKDRGWHLHQVWSSDWFHRPSEELSKVLAAVDQARTLPEQKMDAAIESNAAVEQGDALIARDEQSEVLESNAVQSSPYREAEFTVPHEIPLLEIGEGKLRKIVTEVVSTESPVHRSEVTRRILSLWRQARLGPAIGRKIDAAIDQAIQSATVIQDTDQFLTSPSQTVVTVRSRGDVKSLGLRKPEFIPPAEIHAAMLQLATNHVGITREQLFGAVAKLLGLKVVTQRLRVVLEEQLEQLIGQSQLTEREAMLYVSRG